MKKSVVILELKVAASYTDMENKSQQAIRQIEMKHYEEDLARDGYENVLCYGIAFYKKNCQVAFSERKII